jgi:carboxyl-terminal processing protease
MLPIKSMAVVLTIALSTAVANSAGTSGDTRRESSARLGIQRDTGYRVVDSTLAVATFDSAWRTIGVTLERRGVTRLDWPEVRRELLPRAARAASDSALRAVINDMLSHIGESHFALMPAHVAPAGDGTASASALGTAGLALRVLDSSVVVWRTDSGGAARRAGVLPGWTVERIDDVAVPSLGPADSVGPRRVAVLTGAMRALRGAPGTTVQLVSRDASGLRRIIDITLDSMRGPFSRFGNLPPLPVTFEMTRRTLADGRCAAVIHFEYWMPPVMPALDRAVDSARNCAGIILDLRGNLGGVAGMMMGAAGHFMNEPRTLGIMRSRGEEMRFVANPRRATDAGVPVEPFTGDVAILVDGLSASTSEMFAAAMQAIGRARVFGERTAGQALPAMATRLPSGDVLMQVVADFVAPDGTRIEGRGVIPDEVVPLTRADLVAGRDAALESAIFWFERPRPRNP